MSKKVSVNFILSWLLTPLYNILFVSILVFFHPLLVIAKLFSFSLFLHTLTAMCWFLRLNLHCTIGMKYIFNPLPDLPKNRPIVLVSNHQGTYDIPLLIVYLMHRRLRFISKRELAKWLPSVSFAVRHNRSALIDRGDRLQSLGAIREAARSINEDNGVLCIFPEGTRARHGKMGKFKTGGFAAILKEVPNAIILSVAITGSWKLLRYHFFPVPYGVTVTYTPLKIREVSDQDPSAVLNEIEEEIRKTVDENEAKYSHPRWVR